MIWALVYFIGFCLSLMGICIYTVMTEEELNEGAFFDLIMLSFVWPFFLGILLMWGLCRGIENLLYNYLLKCRKKRKK